MKRIHVAALLVMASAVGLPACAPAAKPGADSQAVRLIGEVTYRQRIALPPDAVLSARIEDVSLMDGPATPVAETRVEAEGRQVPIPFSIDYDPARILPGRRYAVRAAITSGAGRLLWTTDTHIPLPEAGAAPLRIVLVQVRGHDGEDGLPPMATPLLSGTDWLAVGNEPGWRVEIDDEGQLTYQGDYGAVKITAPTPAPLVTAAGRSWSVQSGGHRVTLELASEPCRDDMSGSAYPMTARLAVDGRELRGCGRRIEPAR